MVGASYILDAETGDIATVVNLFRIALLTLAMAIAALGIKTALGQLAQSGWRPFVLILTAMLWLAALPLMSVLFYADFSLYLSVVLPGHSGELSICASVRTITALHFLAIHFFAYFGAACSRNARTGSMVSAGDSSNGTCPNVGNDFSVAFGNTRK